MQLLIECQPTPEQLGAMLRRSAFTVATLLKWLHDKQEGKETGYDENGKELGPESE